MEMVRVENVSKIYNQGDAQIFALEHVSFSIHRGEFVAIMGPSGSGKSTLLHMLGGVDVPDEGRIFIDQTDLSSLDESELAIFRRRQIGLIYQFYNLIPVLNVEENILLPRLLDKRKEDKQRLEELIQVTGLSDRRKHLPNQLSGGQQQRVSTARALINNPAIVLADEPTGSLDSQNSKEVMELLKYSNKKYNQTLIVVTHDERIALEADRIIAIEDGKVTRDEVIR